MSNSKVCPKCNKSREVYEVIEKDPQKKGRSWKITRCPSCAYNFDLEEVTREIAIKEDPEKPKRGRWYPGCE